MKVLKSRIFIAIITAIICITGTAYAISANEITYGNTTVDDALDDLYGKLGETVDWIIGESRQANNSSYTVDNDSYYLCLKYGQWSSSDITGATIVGGNSIVWNIDSGIYAVIVKTSSTTISFSTSNTSIVKIGV